MIAGAATPSLVVATAVTLHEILRDWDQGLSDRPSGVRSSLQSPARLLVESGCF